MPDSLEREEHPGIRDARALLPASDPNALPRTLHPGRIKSLALIAICLAFVAAGVLMVRSGEPKGYLCGGFFALGFLIFAINLHPRAAYLLLTRESFTFCSLFRPHTVLWRDTESFGIVRIGRKKMIGWNFAPTYQGAAKMRTVNQAISGFDASIPDTYGLKPQVLVDLMESIRSREASS